MNETLEWLYDNYTKEILDEIYKEEQIMVKSVVEALPLTGTQKLSLYDLLTDYRFRAGTEIFVAGLQLGIRITAPTRGFNTNIIQ